MKWFSNNKNLQSKPNPFLKFYIPYISIFGILFFANYTILHYRILSNTFFFLLPIAGTVTMYLWFVLLSDEFLDVIKIRGKLAFLIQNVKIFSYIFIIFYGIAAFALWINGKSSAPVRFAYGTIASLEYTHLGLIRYQWATVALSGQDKSMKKILLTRNEQSPLYVGKDIELVTRAGILGLNRILEVRDDNIKYYLKMLQAVPNAKIAYECLIEEYIRRKNYNDALKLYAEYRQKYPDNDDIGHSIGGNLIIAHRFGQAVEVLSKLVETNKEYEVMYLYGYALAWAGRKQDAAEYLIKATEIDPEEYRAYYSLGYVYRDLGKKEEARKAWSKVLELLPNFPEVSNNLKDLGR